MRASLHMQHGVAGSPTCCCRGSMRQAPRSPHQVPTACAPSMRWPTQNHTCQPTHSRSIATSCTSSAGSSSSPTSSSSSAPSRPATTTTAPAAPVPPPPRPVAPTPMTVSSYGYTVSSLYIQKKDMPEFKQVDHAAKRKERDTKEIVEAAAKIGVPEARAREALRSLENLLPDLQPSMDKMRASDWAKVVANVEAAASTLIVLKTSFPRANVSKIISKTPKVLLLPMQRVQDNAIKVKQILASVDGEGEIDAIVEAVPYLLEPQALMQSLNNLQRWFPSQQPVEVLRTNPTVLLNIGEADIAADPLYGQDVGILD